MRQAKLKKMAKRKQTKQMMIDRHELKKARKHKRRLDESDEN